MSRTEFIHISDIHFQTEYSPFANRLIRKSGVDFTGQLRRGMAYILRLYQNIDFFLLSGDLVHEGTGEEYRRLKRLWKELCGLPVYAAPGNHDTDTYGADFLGTDGPPPFDREYIHRKSRLRILSLDSRGGPYGMGRLTARQLAWLREKLAARRDTLLLLHHTPHVSGEVEFLTWQMENPQDLYEAVKGSGVLAIFAGHAHKAFYSTLGDIPCYTADSITHGIDSGEESMTVSNRTGFHHCVYEDGRLTVEHIGIPCENPAAVVIPYGEFGEG